MNVQPVQNLNDVCLVGLYLRARSAPRERIVAWWKDGLGWQLHEGSRSTYYEKRRP